MEACFEGLRRGLAPQREKEVWTKYFAAWRKGKPDFSWAEAVTLARDSGISTAGSARDIFARVVCSAKREEVRNLGMSGGRYGPDSDGGFNDGFGNYYSNDDEVSWECYGGDGFGSDDDMYPF